MHSPIGSMKIIRFIQLNKMLSPCEVGQVLHLYQSVPKTFDFSDMDKAFDGQLTCYEQVYLITKMKAANLLHEAYEPSPNRPQSKSLVYTFTRRITPPRYLRHPIRGS